MRAAGLRDALMPPDPGAVRLRAAMRTTLTGAIAWVALLGLEQVAPINARTILLGVACGLYMAASVRDETVRQQCLTLALAGLAAFAAVLLAIAIGRLPWMGDAVLIVLIFVAIYAPELGARWSTVAALSLLGYLFALLIHPTAGDLPVWLLALLVAVLSGCLVYGVLLPPRPSDALRRMETSIRADVVQVLERIDAGLAEGAWTDTTRHRLLLAMDRLNSATMAAETVAASRHLGPEGGGATARFLALDLATEQVGRTALAQLPPEDQRPAARAGIAAIVTRHGATVPAAAVGAPLSEALDRLSKLLTGAAETVPATREPAATPSPADKKQVWPSPGLRRAIQATIAAGAAALIGHLVSPGRWYWGAMSAYVLFQGTRSRADSLVRALQSLLGTFAGVVAGLLIATALQPYPALSLIAIFVAVFLSFLASQAAYGTMTFWITIVLGLAFGLLGYFSSNLLVARFEETAVGALCGGSVALLTLGTSAATVTRKMAADTLRALLAVTTPAALALSEGAGDPALVGLAVALQARTEGLRDQARSRFYGLAGLGDRALRRLVHILSACSLWGQELALAGAKPDTESRTHAAAIETASARIAASGAALIAILETDAALVIADASEADREQLVVPSGSADGASRAVWLLLCIDAALDHAVRRVAPPRAP